MGENIKKILGIITARGGSKTIPKKNIKLLAGKPLIYWTIKEAQKSQLITKIILSSDSHEIINVAKRYKVEVPFVRPRNLAKDNTPTLPVLQHAITFMEKKDNIRYDYVVILEPTSPLRIVEDLDNATRKAIETKADSVIGMYKLDDIHPMRIKKIIHDRIKPFSVKEKEGTPRQLLPPAYYRNGAVYVIKRDIIIKKNSIWGKDTRPFIMPKERSVDIDDNSSFYQAEYYIKLRRKV